VERQGLGGGYLKNFVTFVFVPKIFSRADENQAVGNLPPFPNHVIMVDSGGTSR